MKIILKNKVKNILVIKFKGIGDVVLSTIVLKNLKAHFIDAKIDFLTELGGATVVSGLDEIDNTLIFDDKSIIGRLKLIFKIRKIKYDLIIDLFSNPFSAQITYFSNALYKVGFPYEGRKYAYNYYGPKERDKYHNADLNLMLLKSINVPIKFKTLQTTSFIKLTKVTDFISQNNLSGEFIIGISPTGGWDSKKCDSDILIGFIIELKKIFNVKIIILYGPGDENHLEEILDKTEIPIKIPKSSLDELIGFIAICNIIIANDSGPMHLATALNIPVISLHGPTNPNLQGPYGDNHEYVWKQELDCIGCNLLSCPKKHECFRNITFSDIYNKIKQIEKKNNIKIPFNEEKS